MDKKKILIVEDEELVARLTRRRVEAMGYTVTAVVRSGEEAIQQAFTTSPDLILMDISLPGKLDGAEAAEQIRAQRDIPVIYITALADDATLLKARQTHPFGYLLKPFEDRELHVLIEMTFQLSEEMAARKRTEEALKRQILEQETLRNAALTLSTTLNHQEVVDCILAQLQTVVPYDTASVQLLRDGRLHLVGGRGFPAPSILSGISFDPQDAGIPNSEVLRTQHSFIVDDITTGYPNFHRPLLITESIRSWMGVPMLIGENLIGMIALDCATPGFYTPAHARLAEAFAAQAALAIENSRLFQAEREQRELAVALEKTALVLNSTLAPDQVLDHILAQIQQIVAGSTYSILLIGADNRARYARWLGYEQMGMSAEQMANATILMEDYPDLQKILQTGKSFLTGDILEDQTMSGWGWLRSQIGAAICVKENVVGFLSVCSNQPNLYTATDAHRLEIFAQYAATAIQNAQMHQQLQTYTDELEYRVHQRTAEVRSQYARLDAILRSARDGIVVAREDGAILQSNPVAERWLSQTLAPAEAQRLRGAIQQVARRIHEMCSVHSGNGDWPDQRPLILLELTGLDLEVSGSPIVLAVEECLEPMPGEAGDVVIMIHDVSYLKVLERMKNDFIANISHEFRTPIATLNSYMHLLQQYPEKHDQYMPAIIRELERQTKLVEDIVELSRLDAGRAELDVRTVALQPFAAAQTAAHEAAAFAKNVQIAVTGALSGPIVIADPDYLTRSVTILIHNAIVYTAAGGKIAVSVGCQTMLGRQWGTLSVADTGHGIAEDELPHIFERFFRGRHPQRMQIQGTGLGLPIAKAIVELQGGHITVESQEGRGSTVTLWLPLSKACE